MRHYLLSCILCVSLLLTSVSYGYFEDRYFCEVEENAITVTIASGGLAATGDRSCFSYLRDFSTQIDTLSYDIDRSQRYIDADRDPDYRAGVQDDLSSQREQWIVLRDQFVAAVDDYEIELFLKVKSLIGYYLMPRRKAIKDKVEQANILLLRLKLAGDEDKYGFVREKLSQMEQQLILLDRIRYAYDFALLVPPLKLYIQGGGFDFTTERDSEEIAEQEKDQIT